MQVKRRTLLRTLTHRRGVWFTAGVSIFRRGWPGGVLATALAVPSPAAAAEPVAGSPIPPPIKRGLSICPPVLSVRCELAVQQP